MVQLYKWPTIQQTVCSLFINIFHLFGITFVLNVYKCIFWCVLPASAPWTETAEQSLWWRWGGPPGPAESGGLFWSRTMLDYDVRSSSPRPPLSCQRTVGDGLPRVARRRRSHTAPCGRSPGLHCQWASATLAAGWWDYSAPWIPGRGLFLPGHADISPAACSGSWSWKPLLSENIQDKTMWQTQIANDVMKPRWDSNLSPLHYPCFTHS